MIHNLDELDIVPMPAGFRVVISGHTHQPSVVTRQGVLYVNPGSAGPRRLALPISMALLRVQGEQVSASVLHLSDADSVRV